MEELLSTWGPIASGLLVGGIIFYSITKWQVRQYAGHLAKVESTNSEIAALNQKNYELNNKHYEAAHDAVQLLNEIKALLEKRQS